MNKRSNGAMIFCALSVPSILLFPSLSPSWLVPIALGFFVLWRIQWEPPAPGVQAVVGLICLGLVIKWGAQAYPTASHGWILNAILLAIAIFAAKNGIVPIWSVAAISFFFILTIYGIIIAFGFGSIDTVYRVQGTIEPSILWLVLPILGCWNGSTDKRWSWAWLAIAVMPNILVALSGITGTFPFYTLTQSISVVGVMERFEMLLSAALTAAQVILMAMLANFAMSPMRKVEEKIKLPTIFAVGMILSLCPEKPVLWLMAIGITICSCYVKLQKKLDKNEKNA